VKLPLRFFALTIVSINASLNETKWFGVEQFADCASYKLSCRNV